MFQVMIRSNHTTRQALLHSRRAVKEARLEISKLEAEAKAESKAAKLKVDTGQ